MGEHAAAAKDAEQGRHDWPSILGVLADGADLDRGDAAWAMDEIMTDNATDAQIAAFGVALKMKGPTPTELDGLAAGMLSHARLVTGVGEAVDIVGTGGDRAGTVNISTMAALVVAGAGVPVVKHGSRAASSKSGGADVLEALGVTIGLGPAEVRRCVEQVGIGFCFAPLFHPALRFAAPARKQIGIPTVFNVLGPLTNPARPATGLIGCAFADLVETMAGVFAQRGNAVLVVRGDDGLDELTLSTTSTVYNVRGGRVQAHSLHPSDVGLAAAPLETLRGGDAEYNAAVARALLAGETGPVRDAVVYNAAAAMAAHEGVHAENDGELAAAIAAAVPRAQESIDSGAARQVLADWAGLTGTLA